MSEDRGKRRRPYVQDDESRAINSIVRDYVEQDPSDATPVERFDEPMTDVVPLLSRFRSEEVREALSLVWEHVRKAERRAANRDLQIATSRGIGAGDRITELEAWRLRMEGMDARNGRLGRLTTELATVSKQLAAWRKVVVAAAMFAATAVGGVIWKAYLAGDSRGAERERIHSLERSIERQDAEIAKLQAALWRRTGKPVTPAGDDQ
jgi:hypothetical protein